FFLLRADHPLRHMAPPLEDLVLRHSSGGRGPGFLAAMPVAQPAAAVIVVVLRAMEQYACLRECPRLILARAGLRAKLQALSAAGTESWQPLLERWLLPASAPLFAECLAALTG